MDKFRTRCNTVFEAIDCFCQVFSCREARRSLQIKTLKADKEWTCVRNANIVPHKERICIFGEAAFYVVVIIRDRRSSTTPIGNTFPFQDTTERKNFIAKFEIKSLFSVVQCHTQVALHLRKLFAKFRPNIKKVTVFRKISGPTSDSMPRRRDC